MPETQPRVLIALKSVHEKPRGHNIQDLLGRNAWHRLRYITILTYFPFKNREENSKYNIEILIDLMPKNKCNAKRVINVSMPARNSKMSYNK